MGIFSKSQEVSAFIIDPKEIKPTFPEILLQLKIYIIENFL